MIYLTQQMNNNIMSKMCMLRHFITFLSFCRTFDGSCNNQRQPKYGQQKTPLQRILPNEYFDGESSSLN